MHGSYMGNGNIMETIILHHSWIIIQFGAWGLSLYDSSWRRPVLGLEVGHVTDVTPIIRTSVDHEPLHQVMKVALHLGGLNLWRDISWEGCMYHGRVTRSLEVTTDKARAVGTPEPVTLTGIQSYPRSPFNIT